MTTTDKRLLRTLANYSRFNAERSLDVDADSKFGATKFGEATALADPARPRLPMFNRVLGLTADDAEHLRPILAHYKSAGCTPHFELSNDAIVPELISELVGSGFEPHDAISYLSCSPGSQPAIAVPQVSIDRWGHDRCDDFRALLATSGVTCQDAVWEARRALYATETFRVFIARRDGQPVAWATSFVDADSNTAYLANAFTQSQHRAAGCHRALLEARLADAKQLGLKTALTDVVPDTSSHRNCKRTGFKRALTLTLWHR